MKIVVDSNILFSALIKDAITRRIILEYDGAFLFPYYIMSEFEKHKQYLIKKSKLNDKEFNTLLRLILSKVKIIPIEILQKYKYEALEIVKNIDKNDAMFFACALAYKDSVIWSDDKALKKQNIIKVLNTTEILALSF